MLSFKNMQIKKYHKRNRMTYCISNDSGAWFGQLATAKNGVAVARDYHLRRLWAAVKCAARCETQ